MSRKSTVNFEAIARELHRQLWDLTDGVGVTIGKFDGRLPQAAESSLRQLDTLTSHARGVVSDHAPSLGIEKSEIPWEG